MGLRYVEFDSLRSDLDFGLILTGHDIGLPAAKTESVELQGADGTLDLSEAFGRVLYGDRKLSFTFAKPDIQDFRDIVSKVALMLNGKRMRIVLSWDDDWYYVGRVSVSKAKVSDSMAQFTVDVTAEPFKYAVRNDRYEIFLDDTAKKVVLYDRLTLPVHPTFAASGTATITCGTVSHVLSKASATYGDISIDDGSKNVISMTGNGTLVVTYQRRSM